MEIYCRLGLSDVTTQKLALKGIFETLEQMPLEATVSWLSSLLTVMKNARPFGHKEDLKLRAIFCNPGLQSSVANFERTKKVNGIVFSRQAVLLLFQIARKKSLQNTIQPIQNTKLNIGYLVLAANDFLSTLEGDDFQNDDRASMLEKSTPLLGTMGKSTLLPLTPQIAHDAAQGGTSWKTAEKVLLMRFPKS
jgi:hypothetical protein